MSRSVFNTKYVNPLDIRKAKQNQHHNLEELGSGFYDEIEKDDREIYNRKKKLKRLKSASLKELVYSNKEIPDVWKNKLEYRDNFLEIIANDPKFMKYLGNGGNKQPIVKEDPIIKGFSKTSTNFFPSKTHLISDSDSLKEIDSNKQKENAKKRNLNSRQREITEKEIYSILDDFRNKYKLNPKDRLEEEIEKKEETKKYPSIGGPSIPNNNTLLSKTCTNFKKPFGGITGIFGLKDMKLGKKQEMFKKNIYSNLIPHRASSVNSNLFNKKKKVKYEETSKYGPFLNFNYAEFNKKIEITNPLVKKYLEYINYFGPYYSYCPPCRNRNLEFYRKLEPNQCIDIVNSIKKEQRRIKEEKEKKFKKNKQHENNNMSKSNGNNNYSNGNKTSYYMDTNNLNNEYKRTESMLNSNKSCGYQYSLDND